MRLDSGSASRLAYAQALNPVVWSRQASRPNGKTWQFRVVVLHESARTALLNRFGAIWLQRYLSSTEAELYAWAMAGTSGRVH